MFVLTIPMLFLGLIILTIYYHVKSKDTMTVEEWLPQELQKQLPDRNKKEIQEMIDDGEPIEVKCQFCNKAYNFDIDELKDILKRAK